MARNRQSGVLSRCFPCAAPRKSVLSLRRFEEPPRFRPAQYGSPGFLLGHGFAPETQAPPHFATDPHHPSGTRRDWFLCRKDLLQTWRLLLLVGSDSPAPSRLRRHKVLPAHRLGG